MLCDFQHPNEHGAKNGDDDEEPDEAKGFAHDGEDGVVDGFWEIAGGLNGITDANAEEPTGTDGKHGVFDVIG